MPETGTKRITRASTEWWSRPDDERYLSLEALHEATFARAHASTVETATTSSLVAWGSETAGGSFYLDHRDHGRLDLTHWSFGQLATVSHTPASWLRAIAAAPAGPALGAHAVNLGLRHLASDERLKLMYCSGEGGDAPELRCLTGPDYGRIFDHQVVEAVMRVNEDGRWHIPAASYQAVNPKRATTLYASDRDVFVFLVDERNPVSLTVDCQQRNLFRGFMVWNSEVGSQRLGMMTFLYDFVCDNRTVWGAREVREISITHRKHASERFAYEVEPALRRYAESSVIEVEATLTRATEKKVGNSDEDFLAWLRSHDFTKKEGDRIIASAKAEEGGARSIWEIVNGGTAVARSIPHADERVSFERRVSRLLKTAA